MSHQDCYLAIVDCHGAPKLKVGVSGNVARRLSQLLGPAQLIAVTELGGFERERFVMDALREVDRINPQPDGKDARFCRGGRRSGEYFELNDDTMAVAVKAMTSPMTTPRADGCCRFCNVTEMVECDRLFCSQCGLEVFYPLWEPTPVAVHARSRRRRRYQYPARRDCCGQEMNVDDRGFAYPMPAAHLAHRSDR